MIQTNQLIEASRGAVRGSLRAAEATLRDIPRIVITAEERLWRRVRSTLRVILATLFLGISGLISLGATATMAFAKKISPESVTKTKRHNSRKQQELRYSEHPRRISRHHQLRGTASWYGGKFQNRRTASGTRFNTHKMTAAHKTLPFGSRVRVTNLNNQKSCIVEITDRGPYVGSRVIDLSYAAASEIGMASSGTAQVELELVGPRQEMEQPVEDRPEFEDVITPRPSFDVLKEFPVRASFSGVDVGNLISEQ